MLHNKEIKRLVEENKDLLEALEDFDRTGILAKSTYKERVNFTIDMELMRKFRIYCKKEGFKMSSTIERLIKTKIL